ncbi:Asp-tRNA(Asn)/Glu-tRNA(Gln) amidotransferase subunit GatA [Thermodesulfobacterium sp. TA1]|uniref:Asp-tRNA(Asn)/Glu-tRNA(Gln) amidotransferase subunit GatA n=1 Tax=Thermodesulfobacterium sp. TA1 TaxID=2234087 RepID=UPI001232D928|nr:Asp-tRNA(Asn)/Glu-tRNA(Gln) amidotransferase subunit GatA [Thermodesulfobacterium sp. TA1]QER41835.1 Asp-tRNA(Asn)/Glu-tRNA(Gln) amidotransferase subunit GatA [Thermodesulfobacterium sp. TA1]
MAKTDLTNLTIKEALELMEKGKISATELVEETFKQIEGIDPKIKAFLHLFKEEALLQAKESDEKRKKGEKGSLLGIPLSIKDNICIKGYPTTCASKILENYIAPYEATVIEKLRTEGAVFIGKTNLDEFAMGSSTENSAFFTTRNPWDLERVPGGSSGGSAAAVAVRMGLGSLGSDTGGSIRQPAAFCGVVGLKPTYGLVSRYGLVAFASSLDQIGPFGLTVEDTAILLKTIAGKDEKDSTSAEVPIPDYLQIIHQNEKTKFKIGLPKEYMQTEMDPEIKQKIEEVVEALKKTHEIKEVSLPHTEYAVATYYIIAPAEASSNLARYDGVKYGLRIESSNLIDMYKKTRAKGFGKEVKRRIMIGTYALSAGYYDAFYLKASKVRTLILRDFLEAFKEVDLLITPVTPTPPFKIGEKITDPLQMYLSDIFTIPVNLAGLPGISLPIGLNSEGLPIGLQIIGPHFREDLLFSLAYQIEKLIDQKFIPPLIKG